MKKLLPILALVLACGAGGFAIAQEVLPPEVAAQLTFLREEEKLAHDVYAYLDAFYEVREPGANIFGRIAMSEDRHARALANQLAAWGLPDPAYEETGRFADPELQDLYDSLVALGEQGVTEALTAGVVIETQDLEDLAAAIQLSLAYPDLVKVYANLLAASENHLAAFNKVLERGSL